MSEQFQNRRAVLKLAGGAVLGTVGLAGCTDLEGVTPGSGTSHFDWVPAADGDHDSSMFIYLDTSEVDRFEDQELFDDDHDDPDEDEDHLAGYFFYYSGAGLVAFSLISGLGALQYPFLSELYDVDDETDTRWYDVVDGLMFAGGAVIVFGPIDVDAVEDAAADSYDRVEDRDGFAIFEAAGSRLGDLGKYFAANEEALVLPVGTDGDEVVDTIVDTASGNAGRLAEQTGDLEWATSTAGDGLIVVGGYDREADEREGQPIDDDFDLGELFRKKLAWDFDADATGNVTSVDLRHDESAFVGESALFYRRERDVPDESEIREQLTPTTADAFDVDVDGTRVEVRGRWELETAAGDDTGDD